MCRPLIFIVLQVLTLEFATSYPFKDFILAYIPIEELAYLSPENIEAIPAPYYSNVLLYDPWFYQSMMMHTVRSPFRQTTGPVTFGGQVKANGAVKIMGHFGNQGLETFTSYSAPPTPLTVTPQPSLRTTTNMLLDTWPTTSSLPMNPWPTTSTLLMDTLPIATALPTLTTLPAVTLPTTSIHQPCTDTMPSTVSVPVTPMPFIVVTTTVPSDVELNGNVASPVKFSGMVPASGRVRISAHFC